jgi:hypothetical protein
VRQHSGGVKHIIFELPQNLPFRFAVPGALPSTSNNWMPVFEIT